MDARDPHDPADLPDHLNPTRHQRDYPLDPLPPYFYGGTINLLVGAPKVGKTKLISHLISNWRKGEVFGAPANPATPHYFLSAGRSFSQSAAKWFGTLTPPVKHYCLLDDPTFPLEVFRRKGARGEAFVAALDKLSPPRGSVVWVDPLTLFLGGSLLDYEACALACLDIHSILAKRALTLIGTADTSKPKVDVDRSRSYVGLLDRIYGTISQLSFAHTAMYLASPLELDKPGVHTLHVHSHHAKAINLELMEGVDGAFVTAPPDAEFASVLQLIPLDQDIEVADLRRLLVPHAMSRATLFRLLKSLIAERRLVKVKYGTLRRAVVH